MKKQSLLTILAIASSLLASCSDEYTGAYTPSMTKSFVSVGEKQLTFAYTQSSRSVRVDAQGKWNATTSSNWIDVSPSAGTDGGSVTVSVTANTQKSKRNGTVTIGYETIAVEQDFATLNINADEATLPADGGAQNIAITSNAEWRAVLTAPSGSTADVDWLTVSPMQGSGNATVALSASKNIVAARNAYLKFESIDGIVSSDRIIVTQAASEATEITTLPDFEAAGGTYDFKHIVDFPWTAKAQDSWVTLSAPSGSTTTAPLTITVAPTTDINPRSSYVELAYGNGVRYNIRINQKGAGLKVGAQQYDFFAKGGTSAPIAVEHVSAVTASSSASWLTASVSGNQLTLTASPNETSSQRQATITISLSGTAISATITVRQAGTSGTFSAEGFDSDENWN